MIIACQAISIEVNVNLNIDDIKFRTYLSQTILTNEYTVPNCVIQYMTQDIETVSISIDMQCLEKKLDMMLDIWLSTRYRMIVEPQSVFYIRVSSPL
ncbi:unnamed protein product [Adineta steineri]|uniref:Uncharacterized protein n=1 Tax=Adineta steineri TaxID=433720 RepID=A0A815AD68_9BILA|nr:unnamed protein product [Adineta steineri]CAF4181388.1 unnamed protein product [Adineta steineri]